MYETKKLETSELNRLQLAEKEIGCCLVAIQKPPQLAHISATGLKKLQKLEKDLDTIIVAYECPGTNTEPEQDCCPPRSEHD